MRRHFAWIVVLALALAAPAAAPAKELSQISVCGTGGNCTTYDKSDVKNLSALAQDGGPTDPPPAAAPWYRVRFTVDAREDGGGYERWTVVYVPAADSLRVRDEFGTFAWVALNPRAARLFARAARGLPAFPKEELRGLDVKAPEARIAEVYAPAEAEPGSSPWGWIAGGALVTLLIVAGIGRYLRLYSRTTVEL